MSATLLASAAPPTPKPGRRYRTRAQLAADYAQQITDARHLREIAYDKADRADGDRRRHLLRRAAECTTQEEAARRRLAAVAPGHPLGRE